MKTFHFNGIHIVSRAITDIISLGRANAITIFPFVFYRTAIVKQSTITKTHEIIHIKQQIEMGLAGLVCSCMIWLISDSFLVALPALFMFYWWYLGFYIACRITYKKHYKAYMENPFEKEAYMNDNFKYYPEMRKWFSWRKYF